MSLFTKVMEFFDLVEIVHDVAHGGVTTTVPTEGGNIDSLAKVINDCKTQFNDATAGDLAQSTAAKNAAEAAATSAAASAALIGMQYMHVREEQPPGTAGGAAHGDVEYQRTLNTVVTNTIAGASLSENKITLPAGRYHIHAVASATTSVHQSKVVSVSGDTVNMIGMAMASSSPSTTSSDDVKGVVTLAQETVIKLVTRHGTVGGVATANDLGRPQSKYVEIYSEVEIWKLP